MLEKHLDYLNTNHFLSSLSPLAFHEHLSSSFSPFSSSLSRALSLSFSSCSSSSHLNISTRNTRLNYASYYLRSKEMILPFCANHGKNKRKNPWRAAPSFFLSLLDGNNKEKNEDNASSLFLLYSPFHLSMCQPSKG